MCGGGWDTDSIFMNTKSAGLDIATLGNYSAQKKAGDLQQRAYDDAKANAAKTAQQAEEAFNRANRRKPDIAAILADAQKKQGGTMLTQPGGVDPATLTLGRTTLLGA